MSVLLVVDDEPAVIALFTHIFRASDILVEGVGTVQEAMHTIQHYPPDAVMLDMVLPDGSGMDVFRKIQLANSQIPVVIMTGGGDSETAIQAIQMGAMDYLTKPLDVLELDLVVRRAIEVRRLMAEPMQLETVVPNLSPSAIIGRSPEMQRVYKSIGRVASQNISVLIRGESGTGKELIARAIYQYSERFDKPFLAVNCAAIPDALLESELFGHEKGAFTGADRRRVGKFEQCEGGTLFLDEIGDMDAQLQSKLLRVLQEKQFQRVGGSETLESNVRVVAATHRNLEQMCRLQKFREDLYYRLNGFTISLPPLREREQDLEMLIDFFLLQSNREFNKQIARVEPSAMEKLRRYSWPGNVRELQSVIRQSMLQSSGTVLLADFLPDLTTDSHLGTEPDSGTEPGSVTGDPKDWLNGEPAIRDSKSLKSFETVACLVENLVAVDGQTATNKRLPLDESVSDTGETLEHLIQRHQASPSQTLYEDVIDEVERKLIAAILDETNGNQSETAKRLGITRTTLRTKINKLGIGIRLVVDEGSI